MIDAPRPPRRRRRKIIVALLLVLVSLGTWWYWPRGDARFVGKWTDSRGEGVYEFRSNAVVYWTNPQIGGPTAWATWSAKDDVLQTGQPPDVQTHAFHRYRHAAWTYITDQQWLEYGFFAGPLRVVGLTPESILFAEVDLDTGETLDRFTFTRIPE